jgi:enediyne biosynthesis protein E4
LHRIYFSRFIRIWITIAATLLASGEVSTQSRKPVRFNDVAASANLNFKHQASMTAQKYLPETMGGGVAIFDYDNDGWLDVFFTNGAQLSDSMPAGSAPDKSASQYWNRLYRNQGDGRFEDVTERAGLQGSGYGMGAACGDYDNDGFVDLYVTHFGGGTLYRNRGDGSFEDVTAKTGTGGAGWMVSAGWTDYDNDGDLDLFVCRYMVWDFSYNPPCGDGVRAYCHPRYFQGVSSLLFRNDGQGAFTDVSEASGIAKATAEGKALGVAFADYDQDGWQDIFIAQDSIRQTLLHNRKDGTFEDTALLAGVGYDDNGKSFAGMGVAFDDYNNDGWPDVFITNLSNETYAVYHNNGDETFAYATNATGVGEATSLFSGWGLKLFDYDHDGWRDVFIAQGHVLDTIEMTSKHLRYEQAPLLLRNNGKRFVNVGATAGEPFTQPRAGRGAAVGDLNNDGDLDVVVSNTNQAASLLLNDGGHAAGNWLIVKLIGQRSNRQGLGARIRLTNDRGEMQFATVTTAGSYASSSDSRAHFGLGQTRTVKQLEVKWPSGVVQVLNNIKPNQVLTIKESVAAVAPKRRR